MSPWLSILCCTFPYDPNHLANHKNCPGTSIQIVATFAFFSFKFLGFIRHEPRPQDKKIRRRKKTPHILASFVMFCLSNRGILSTLKS